MGFCCAHCGTCFTPNRQSDACPHYILGKTAPPPARNSLDTVDELIAIGISDLWDDWIAATMSQLPQES